MSDEQIQQPEQAETREVKKVDMSQGDLNNLIAREKKSGQEKLLKELGVDNLDSVKDGLAKLREIQEAQKTDLEKANDNSLALTKEIEALKAGNSSTLADKDLTIELLKSGVSSEQLDRAFKLSKAGTGETIADIVKNTLEEFPGLKGQQVQKGADNVGAKTGNSTATEKEQTQAQIRRSFGLS